MDFGLREGELMSSREGHIRNSRYIVGVGALAFFVSCATLPKAEVVPGEDGRLDVQVTEEQSVRALAVNVYGDVKLADALAESAGLSADEPVAAGTTLKLPSKAVLKRRIADADRARKLRAEAAEAQRKGDWEKTAKLSREALELSPGAESRRTLGVALLRTGHLEESLHLLSEGSILYPEDAGTRYAYGAALRESGNLAEALEELDAAVRLDEHLARARYDRARTLRDLGRNDEARDAYREFLFAFPDDPWADDARRQLDELGS
jgi:tetratricopeptide (TPR) repeat protein